jgi:hypothetical protein
MLSGFGHENLDRKIPGKNSENCVFLVEISSFRHERLYRMTGDMEGDMETYLTIAGLVKLSEQTIRRYVLNRTIPYLKIYKAVRFRPSEIETWIDGGGISASELFAEAESEVTTTTEPDENAGGNPQGLLERE